MQDVAVSYHSICGIFKVLHLLSPSSRPRHFSAQILFTDGGFWISSKGKKNRLKSNQRVQFLSTLWYRNFFLLCEEITLLLGTCTLQFYYGVANSMKRRRCRCRHPFGTSHNHEAFQTLGRIVRWAKRMSEYEAMRGQVGLAWVPGWLFCRVGTLWTPIPIILFLWPWCNKSAVQ